MIFLLNQGLQLRNIRSKIMVLEQQEAIIEAVLFSMGESVELEKIAEVLELSKKELN